ncbi:hypothetical protein TNCV_3901211 [Trichonephila clavipes]|nr:hypothetical protein TNCV_3901211 [Trichonephila clavipes]
MAHINKISDDSILGKNIFQSPWDSKALKTKAEMERLCGITGFKFTIEKLGERRLMTSHCGGNFKGRHWPPMGILAGHEDDESSYLIVKTRMLQFKSASQNNTRVGGDEPRNFKPQSSERTPLELVTPPHSLPYNKRNTFTMTDLACISPSTRKVFRDIIHNLMTCRVRYHVGTMAADYCGHNCV